MAFVKSYKKFNQFLQNETLEPTLGWGVRMAIASVVPVLWGLLTNHGEMAEWIALTAEAICWVELKGAYGQRLRVLMGGAFLTVAFAILGSITGTNIWLSIMSMLVVGFVSSLFKNLGDRGSGLSICVYVMFIIANAYPTHNFPELENRVLYILIGGAWNLLVGIVATVFMPAQLPYRRSIAIIWKAVSGVIESVSKGWDGKSSRSNIRDIYLQEQHLRTAIDSSIHFHGRLVDQVKESDRNEYQLAHLRKATALVGTHIIAISEELEGLGKKDIGEPLQLKMYAIFKSLQQTTDRMAVYIISTKPEEELLLISRIERLNRLLQLLKESEELKQGPHSRSLLRVAHLTERAVKLIQTAMKQLQEISTNAPVYRSYSLMKTLFVLHPKHWWRNIRLLFNLNTFTTRYALRTALAATIGMFIFKWFGIDRGYWLPFTVIIVIQPYFGATFKKAIDRVIGTVLGGVAGGLLHAIPTMLHIKEILLFVCAICMVYFLRKKYSVAAFFITLSLVLLFEVEKEFDVHILLVRALCTVGGALLGVTAGFLLLPTWDKKWLPKHLIEAVVSNYAYFTFTFFPKENNTSWTKYKRDAESNNSNLFDSFNRYMQEPTGKKSYIIYYHLITHNVKLTRELNNIHLEQEHRTDSLYHQTATQKQQNTINECLFWFNKNIELIQEIDPEYKIDIVAPTVEVVSPFLLSTPQQLYIEKMVIELMSMYENFDNLVKKSE